MLYNVFVIIILVAGFSFIAAAWIAEYIGHAQEVLSFARQERRQKQRERTAKSDKRCPPPPLIDSGNLRYSEWRNKRKPRPCVHHVKIFGA